MRKGVRITDNHQIILFHTEVVHDVILLRKRLVRLAVFGLAVQIDLRIGTQFRKRLLRRRIELAYQSDKSKRAKNENPMHSSLRSISIQSAHTLGNASHDFVGQERTHKVPIAFPVVVRDGPQRDHAPARRVVHTLMTESLESETREDEDLAEITKTYQIGFLEIRFVFLR